MSLIAVVGGTSAVAGRLVPLLERTHEVVTLGRSRCDVECDLMDEHEQVRLPPGTDAVVHLAAAFGGSTDEEMLSTLETNVTGTLRVCMAARRVSARHLLLVSSVYSQLTEVSPHYGMYSISKRHAEELATHYCRRHSMLLTVLRPSQLYAEEEAFRRHQPFLYHIADCAERGSDIELHGSHDALRNYLHADDLARTIAGVLEKEPGGTHPCTFPRDFRLSEVAAAAQEAFGRGGSIVWLREKPDVSDNVFGNSMSLYERIGVFPSIDIQEGMRRLAHRRRATRH